MFKHDKSKDQSQDAQIDPEITNLMGPLPADANPVLPANKSVTEEPPKPQEPIGPPIVQNMAVPKEVEITENPYIYNKKSSEELGTEPIIPPQNDLASNALPDVEDDPKIDEAVRDIIVHDGDQLLQDEDQQKAKYEIIPSRPKGIKGLMGAWWHNRKLRNSTLLGLVLLVVALALVPYTRYIILNIAGARASTSLSIVDIKSGRPIKNVEVTIAGQVAATDSDGKVAISGIRLGKTQLELKKRSFATIKQSVVIGWGSNPYPDPFQMSPVGSNYNFVIKDWLSQKPVAKTEISDGDSVAITDDSGKATLTIEPKTDNLKLTIKSAGYRQEAIQIDASHKAVNSISLVPAPPDVFVSRRSGKYDLYKRDVDGKNEIMLLPGTGSEQEDTSLLVHPSSAVAAYVSSREGKRDKDGYLLSNLYIVDLNTKSVSKVEGTQSERIQLIDWVGDKLIFVKVIAGPSASVAGRQRIISYDYKQDKQTEIAAANYFNDVEVIGGRVYYAPSSNGAPSGSSQLFRANADNSSKVTLVNKEVWTLYRNSYDKVQIAAANNTWYETNINDGKTTTLKGSPPTRTYRLYTDAPGSENSVWIDSRDGKGVLLLRSSKTGSDKILYSKAGLGLPVRWLSPKYLVFRVYNSQETANYVINIDGGEAKKIGDVTNTSTTSRWYYYQ